MLYLFNFSSAFDTILSFYFIKRSHIHLTFTGTGFVCFPLYLIPFRHPCMCCLAKNVLYQVPRLLGLLMCFIDVMFVSHYAFRLLVFIRTSNMLHREMVLTYIFRLLIIDRNM